MGKIENLCTSLTKGIIRRQSNYYSYKKLKINNTIFSLLLILKMNTDIFQPINKKNFIEKEILIYLNNKQHYYTNKIQEQTFHAVEILALQMAAKKKKSLNMNRVPLRNIVLIRNGFTEIEKNRAILEARAYAEQKYQIYIKEHIAYVQNQLEMVRAQLNRNNYLEEPIQSVSKKYKKTNVANIICSNCEEEFETVLELVIHRSTKECL